MPLQLTRRQFVAGAAGAVGGIGVAAAFASPVRRAFVVEPERLAVTTHRVGSLDPAAPVLRVAQLSDLHLREIGAHEERVAAAVAVHRPDLIVFTGDAVDDRDDLPLLEEFLALLDAKTRKLAVVGNRERAGAIDVRTLARLYARHQCELLINDVDEFQVEGRRVLVTGLDDLIGGTPDPARALVGAEATPNHLLLAHVPTQRDRIRWTTVEPRATAGIPDGPVVDLAPYRPLWMLAGHTHGGQIRLFDRGLFRPRGSGRYVSGWYRNGAPAMYVSRGIGTSVIDARHRATPELPLFDWGLE